MLDKADQNSGLVSGFSPATLMSRWKVQYGNRLRHPTSPAFDALFTGIPLVHHALDEASQKNAGQYRR
jgi:hypothetical protein